MIYSESVICLDKAIWPGHSITDLHHGNKHLCWRFNCWRCRQSIEGVAIHTDCFGLFMKECQTEDALDRLWAAVVSRRPWRGAPDLRLGRDANFDMELVCAKAEEYGFQCFKLLPPELIRLVYAYSSLATFWRYVAIVGWARELRAAPTASCSLPLRDVETWRRGQGRPALLPSPPEWPSSIRLTIDGHGVKQIERLPGIPPFRRWVSENTRFIILTEGVVDQLENIMVQYKVKPIPSDQPSVSLRVKGHKRFTKAVYSMASCALNCPTALEDPISGTCPTLLPWPTVDSPGP